MKTLYLFCIALSVTLHSFAEKKNPPSSKTEQLQHYMQQSEKFAALYPQEKVYVHFDNSSYYIGEHIWFKAYVTTATMHQLSTLSKTLYVELLNKEGFLVERKTYPIINGQAAGDFLLKDSCEASFYEIRAYTRWMRNWDEACVFSRILPVFNAPEENNMWQQTMLQRERTQPVERRKTLKTPTGKFHLSFYPEGGDLVNGITSQIAFKAFDEEGGSAQNVVGKVYRKSNNQVVAEFNTQHDGMGIFTLTPQEGEKYVALLTQGKNQYEFDLPQSQVQGYTLQINNYPTSRLVVTIHKSPSLKADTLGFTASCRGQVYASQLVITTDSTGAQFFIPKTHLPEGIMQLTLFTHEGKILCERMAYIRPTSQENELKIQLNEGNLDLNSCALNQVNFLFTDTQGKPLPKVGFSVSIRDSKTELKKVCNESARVNLLLSSDLKGYIHHPEYYFETPDNLHLQNLDLLMLVQGWRRYDWKQLASIEPFTPKFQIEKGITIDGRVTHLMAKNKPYKKVRLSYMLFGGNNKPGFDFDEMVANDAGEFSTTLQFFGVRPIVIQTRNKSNKRRETYIQLYRNFRPEARPLSWEETHPELTLQEVPEGSTDKLLKKLDPENKNLLDEVIVKGNRRKFKKHPPLENLVIDVDEAIDDMRDRGIEPFSIYAILNEYDPYFYCDNLYDISPRILRHKRKKIENEICIPDPFQQTKTHIENTTEEYNNFREWAKNRIEKSPFGIKRLILSDRPVRETKDLAWAWEGKEETAVLFYVLHDNAWKKSEDYGIRKSRIHGYNTVSSFYSPQYIAQNPGIYDGRRTLMWMPDLLTDEQGYARMEFYNSPTCREFIIDLQCITRDGKIGSFRKIINENKEEEEEDD